MHYYFEKVFSSFNINPKSEDILSTIISFPNQKMSAYPPDKPSYLHFNGSILYLSVRVDSGALTPTN